MRNPFYILRTLLFVALFASGPAVFAQKQATKVSKNLLQLSESGAKNARIATGNLHPVTEMYRIKNGKILIEAFAETSTTELTSDLKKLGASEIASKGKLVTGFIPLESVDDLKTLKSLKFAKPSLKPVTNTGSVTSQGDISQQSDNARSIFGVDGAGVKVGVLSDSYDFLEGAAGNVATGDLSGAGNPNGYTEDVEVLLDDAGADEGRAMLEIIHDVAPGASLAFNTANLGRAAFAQGIVNLANAGCDIIVDDISYLNEPYFQDGLVAQAVDSVNGMGVAYFSSAGNQLRSSYESEFRGSEPMDLYDINDGFLIGNYSLHDFDPGPGVDYFQEVTIPANGSIQFAFQWDEPYASACSDCPGSSSDLDIFLALVDNDLNSIYFDLSGYDYNLDGDPFEFLGVGVGNADVTVYIVIGKYMGFGDTPDPGKIKYIDYGGYEPTPEYATHSSTISGHHNAAGCNSVGAVRYDRTPAYGIEVPRQEIFSSVGGLQVLYDTKGNRIAPQDRMKPDFSAVQGGNSTFFGFDYEGDGLNNFFGTSASAPHAAAIAALMKNMDPSLSNDDINQLMESNAIDMDDPFTPSFDTGFDYGTGYGFLSASNILAAMDTKPSVTSMNFIGSSNDEFLKTVWGGVDVGDIEDGLLNITADVSGSSEAWEAKSVVFQLTGANWFYNRENNEPYSLFGSRRGHLNGWPLSAGSYQITATPYSRKNGHGKKGNSLTKTFEVTFGETVDEPVLLTFVNPATGETIEELHDGDTLNIADLSALNVLADAQIENVRSVYFELDGPVKRQQMENVEPFTLFGDFFGRYNSWTPVPGDYTLKVTPYSFYFGLGDEAPTQVVHFTLLNPGNSTATKTIVADSRTEKEVEDLPLNYSFKVYPNPTQGDIVLEAMGSRMDETLEINVFNSQGQLVLAKEFSGLTYQNIDLKKFGTGLFIVKMSGEKFEDYKKIIVN